MNNKIQNKDSKTEIIIVEDSPTQAEQLKYLLEKHNFVVLTADNGEDALTLIRQHKPAVVISDIVMPQMDGYELCRRIKADTKLKNIPVILLTALADPQDVMRSLECGADNFVPKSCDQDYLFKLIYSLLANDGCESSIQTSKGIDVNFEGQKYFVTSNLTQVITLLLSTYRTAIQKNNELLSTQKELRELNNYLEQKVEERTIALRQEIEERKRAEKELKQLNTELESRVTKRTQELESSKSFLAAILDSTLDAILTIDEQGMIQSLNKRTLILFGYDEHDLLGTNMEALLPIQFRQDFKKNLLKPLKTGREEIANIYEVQALRKGDEEFDCEISVSRVDDIETGNSHLFTVVMRDISERKQAEKTESESKMLRIEQLEHEIYSLEQLTSLPNTATTAETLGLKPLHRIAPEIFDKAVAHYSSLLELSLEQRSHKVEYDIPEKLHAIAQELGYIRAGPRDIIEIHSLALKEKTKTANPLKAEAYAVEGRVMALEFMGNLVSYYRANAIGANVYKSNKNSAADGKK
jgi:PAS domain S-box-containing protein